HVDRSIEDPELFLRTNVMGTQVLLDTAKNTWQTGKDDHGYPTYRDGVKFLQVSTDEVYGALGKDGYFTEDTPLAPNSPYSASKASADMMARAYNKTFKLPLNITRCSNNYGPYQFPEKLIPLMVNNAKTDKALPVYGDGKQVRDWLYVDDHCAAIDLVLWKAESGEVYNIGGHNEMENIQIVGLILERLGKDESLIKHVRDRQGHDRRYAIDPAKIKRDLGWEPTVMFKEGIGLTIDWYLANDDWLGSVLSGAYQKYYDDMYKDR
ncbi:MAG: dTDP-glucose 4,6-dehydratase, partial [Eubacteriales bacterium]